MTAPLLLDLFCGAGGAGAGYRKAGFFVVGCDSAPQANYPLAFRHSDAMALLRSVIDDGGTLDGMPVAAVHASPPCQYYSYMSACRPGLAAKYPALIEPLRELLTELHELTGAPWVIENVPGARSAMRDPITLCGTMFGYELYRHRLFESSFEMGQPDHPLHVIPASKAGHWIPGTIMSVAGHVAPVSHARAIMAMDWSTRAELVEAIPPYYTELIGSQMILYVK